MPKLSNISHRLNLLTIDAKPDPPQLPVKDYTHNLNSSTVKEETRDGERVSGSTTMQRNNMVSVENKPLSNNVIPNGNVNCYTIPESISDSETSANDAKDRKKPNVKTRTKSKQRKYSQKANIVNYNIINSNGVKIGARTSYICNINQLAKNTDETAEESKNREMPLEIEHACSCMDQMTLNDIFIIKSFIGRGWRDVARKLLYSEGQIEQFEENYRSRGIGEVIYQLFLDWKQANTKDAKIGNLISVLWCCKEYDCVERLVSARKNTHYTNSYAT